MSVERINAILVNAWVNGEDTLTAEERAALDEAWRRECEDADNAAREVATWR